jgi:hypothetical protein
VQTRNEPLTKRERNELQGYVSAGASVSRAVLFLITVGAVAGLSWRVQQGFAATKPFWMLPTLLVAIVLYFRARRWTGGRELRDEFKRDLESNSAVVHRIQVRDAIVFEEQEDEGPVVFVLTETGETVVFVGQDLARQMSRGFPWQEFDVRETAHSRRFLRLERISARFAVTDTRPPLSPERFKELGLSAVARWKPLDVPFEQIRESA